MSSGNSLAMMPWFPRDFIAATRHLALAERGAYRELLDHQWEMGQLPTDHSRLARILGITESEFSEIWISIKDKFVEIDGKLLNKRLEDHRKDAILRRDRKIDGANKTNAKRAAERIAERDDIETPPSPSPSPSIEEKKRFSPPSIDEVKEFFESKGYPLEAEKFFNFYSSKGWMVGKNKMVSWKSSASGWLSRDRGSLQKIDKSLPAELRNAKWM